LCRGSLGTVGTMVLLVFIGLIHSLGASDQVLIFSALKVGGCFPGEIPYPDGDFKGKCGLRVHVLRLWRPFSGLRRHYASCGTSRLRCW
jgi:hypothetical protein